MTAFHHEPSAVWLKIHKPAVWAQLALLTQRLMLADFKPAFYGSVLKWKPPGILSPSCHPLISSKSPPFTGHRAERECSVPQGSGYTDRLPANPTQGEWRAATSADCTTHVHTHTLPHKRADTHTHTHTPLSQTVTTPGHTGPCHFIPDAGGMRVVLMQSDWIM